MKKNILIIHYNTTHLTECLVRSINLFVEDAIIYIFDNSDKNPFTAKFDNVNVFDNTKGQIIDFNKWLRKYPNKKKSAGRANLWASAKHSYSIEKGMELIGENFILLDSDVLLKKDISDLFDDSVIGCGEIINQPRSSIQRIVPFIMFMNVEMCKKNGVHYFNDRYMHGLRKCPVCDSYDTGAHFFLATRKLPFKEIKYDDYILHYNHGSWKKPNYKQSYTPEEWLDLNKQYWMCGNVAENNVEKKSIMKKVVYTCITGGYDTLTEPKYVSDGFDYVCFTDNAELKSNIWKIRPLPKETEGLSQIKKQRYVKINPHLLLKEYDISIWVDGNVTLRGDLNKLVNNTLTDDCAVYVPQHPRRDCIYTEARIVLSMKKDTKENIDPQIERYKKEGFPSKYGLLQSNIMLRKHNDDGCIRLMEKWFSELKDGSHRDQLSFNYASWKNQDVKVVYMPKNIYISEFFLWTGKHNKQLKR